MPITIGVVRETAAGERRVALVPEVATKFAALGARLVMEKGAGTAAAFPDSAYKNVEFVDSAAAVLAQADVFLAVQPPAPGTVAALMAGAVVAGYLSPHLLHDLVRALRDGDQRSRAPRDLADLALELDQEFFASGCATGLGIDAEIAGGVLEHDLRGRYRRAWIALQPDAQAQALFFFLFVVDEFGAAMQGGEIVGEVDLAGFHLEFDEMVIAPAQVIEQVERLDVPGREPRRRVWMTSGVVRPGASSRPERFRTAA